MRVDECDLPETGWGWLHLTGSTQHIGQQDWGDSGAVREDRELKHRSKTATRDVPAAPPLVRTLRWHLARFGYGRDGRLFVSPGYPPGPVSNGTYTRAWRQARAAALTPAQLRSPLAKVPVPPAARRSVVVAECGVPATQVAEWAGHSVNVLLKVYAKCVDGQDEAARRRIERALDADVCDQ